MCYSLDEDFIRFNLNFKKSIKISDYIYIYLFIYVFKYIVVCWLHSFIIIQHVAWHHNNNILC